MLPLQTADALKVFDLSLSRMPRMIAMPVDWRVVAPELDWSMKLMFGDFIKDIKDHDLLQTVRPTLATTAVEMLRSAVSKVTQVDVVTLDDDDDLDSLGFDSLTLEELRRMVNKELGAQILDATSSPEFRSFIV